MRILNWIWKGSIGTIRVLYLLLAAAVILAVAYILGGYEFLAREVWGTDLRSALAMAAWVDKYFPRVPFWYPLAGGGVSLTHSYPVFSFYLVSILKRITDLNLIQSFAVLGFSSVYLMALGIYTFVALRFKNQTAALIASIFYLISPIAWTWLYDWGFYAEAVSHIFVMPAIIFWDLFFISFLDDPKGVKNRVYLVLTVIFLSLSLLTHFGSGLGVMGFFSFYILSYTIKAKEKKKVFARGVLALSLVGILAVLATAFTTLPYYRYTKIVAQGGLSGGPSFEQVEQSALSPSIILGLKKLTREDFLFAARKISFIPIVSVFALLGAFIFSWSRSRVLALTLFSAFSLFLTTNPKLFYWISTHLPWPIPSFFSIRFTLVSLRVVLPILAALGLVGIFSAPLFWLKNRFLQVPKGLVVAILALVLAGYTLYRYPFDGFPGVPRPKYSSPRYDYGAEGIDLRNIWRVIDAEGHLIRDFCPDEDTFADEEEREAFEERYLSLGGYERWCRSPLVFYFSPLEVANWCALKELEGITDLPGICYPETVTEEEVFVFWEGCKDGSNKASPCERRFFSIQEQMDPHNWPKLKVLSALDPNPWLGLSQNLGGISRENPSARIDFSPYLSSQSMVAPFYNLDRKLSQIHVYVVSACLVHRLQGRQQIIYYLNAPQYQDSELINNFARWFGINYVFFNSTTDSEIFKKSGWEVFSGSWGSGVLKFPEENSLANLSDRTSVLAIGQRKVDAYDQVFELASFGVLPYKDAFVVWGKGAVDGYSLEELKSFDVLVLHGYTYRSRQRADELLKDYVMGGGKLFIDTGWQYTTPDWETEWDLRALDVIPFNRLSWLDLGKTGDFVLEDSEVGGGVDISQFAPLIYGDQPWRVSTSGKSDLRDWAKVVLSVKDYPLIVTGELGEGRVVWSGMNIFPHARQKEDVYPEEIKLLTNLFSWLNEGASANNFAVTYTRDHPDKVEFTIGEDMPDEGFLLWKEGYHPDFHATLATSDQRAATRLETYRAGPGWALIKVPELKEGDKIIYEYRLPLAERASSATSFLTLFFLPAIVVEGVFLKEKSLFLRSVQALERKLYQLFFELWRKPFGWWGEKDEEA